MKRRRLAIVDEVVEVQFPDDLQAVADGLYADAAASTGDPTLTVQVQRRSAGLEVAIDGVPAGQAKGPPDLYELLQRELTYALLRQLCPRYLLLHAGAVEVEAACLLLPGDHDSGKSSLSLELGLRGRFFSDDVTPLTPDNLSAHPFPRELVLHAGTRQRHPALPRPTPCAHFEEYDYLPATLAGLTWGTPASVDGLVFPRRISGAAPRIRQLGPAEVARRLLEQCFDLEKLGVRSVEAVANLARRPAIEAHFDSADGVAPAVQNWARRLSESVVVAG